MLNLIHMVVTTGTGTDCNANGAPGGCSSPPGLGNPGATSRFREHEQSLSVRGINTMVGVNVRNLQQLLGPEGIGSWCVPPHGWRPAHRGQGWGGSCCHVLGRRRPPRPSSWPLHPNYPSYIPPKLPSWRTMTCLVTCWAGASSSRLPRPPRARPRPRFGCPRADPVSGACQRARHGTQGRCCQIRRLWRAWT